jgi:hypothetical protein
MVGGAAGGVHRGARGRPHYAQVRGREPPNLAAGLGRRVGFQSGSFPIVLPLFSRASCCTALSSVMRLSRTSSKAWSAQTVVRGEVAPVFHCICIVVYNGMLRRSSNAARDAALGPIRPRVARN